jgi:hypothetical protein
MDADALTAGVAHPGANLQPRVFEGLDQSRGLFRIEAEGRAGNADGSDQGTQVVVYRNGNSSQPDLELLPLVVPLVGPGAVGDTFTSVTV